MRVSLVLVVHDRLALTRACLATLEPAGAPLEVCIVDNASADDTEAFFRRWPLALPGHYHRNAENVGLIRALNQGAALASGEAVCFLHNDTEMRDPRWLGRLTDALADGAGLAGLYGARRLRRDGRYVGRTIVHCLAGTGNLRADSVEVAAVDGVCLTVPADLFRAIGGFDESYGFFHGYDRDLSFAVREAGRPCVVVNAPFVHHGGGTRTGPGAPVAAAEVLAQRRAALARFAAKWRHRLPADVRSPRERAVEWLRSLTYRASPI